MIVCTCVTPPDWVRNRRSAARVNALWSTTAANVRSRSVSSGPVFITNLDNTNRIYSFVI
jgi:hypothetical protein